jgi:hypothetical protein
MIKEIRSLRSETEEIAMGGEDILSGLTEGLGHGVFSEKKMCEM